MHRDSDSSFIRHSECPECGSRDNLAVYTDHSYCFGCEYYEGSSGDSKKMAKPPVSGLIETESVSLTKRGLHEETCRKWGYGVGIHNNTMVQVATYRDSEGHAVSQKVRYPDKRFVILGDTSRHGTLLYGQHLWGTGGKMIAVVEGELDALSCSQSQGLKWPCVSVPNGSGGAAKAIAANLEWLESFESVVFLMDNDDAGRKAATECAELLPPGKAKVAVMELKDANEMLVAGRGPDIVNALFRAKPYRPDGLVYGEDLWDQIKTRENMRSLPYPWAGWNEMLHGVRSSEMVVLTSGTGIGKSSICRELAYHAILQGEKVGYLALEESVVRSSLGLVGVAINKPVHLDHVFAETPEEELKLGFDRTLGSGNCVFYDHFGSLENTRLLGKIRQMIKGCGVTTIFLDHLSIVVSAIEGGDERRRIDSVCTQLRQLIEETKVSLFLVSHLRRSEGKPLEEGGKTSLNLLRGSAAIGQLADIVIGVERDQQGDRPNVSTVRCLKNRYSGETGTLGYLDYNRDTGRMTETTGTEQGGDDYGF